MVGTTGQGSTGRGFGVRTTETQGWRPTCDCDVSEAVPCRVLDPFSGTATVGKVALEHGRAFIGIDLHDDYLDLAKERLGLNDTLEKKL